MKKVVLFLGLIAFGMASCQKYDDSVNATTSKEPKDVDMLSESSTLKTAERAYKWVNGKLDCTQAGTGCEIAASYLNNGNRIDLFPLQVMKLMQYSGHDLNQYFVDSNLSYEFPSLYAPDTFQKIESGEYKLDFEFPYLEILNQAGEIEKVFNYDSTLSNPTVLSYFQTATDFNKQISMSTTPGTVWKCIDPGNNCRTALFNINLNWLATNTGYVTQLSGVNITSSTITKNSDIKQILFKTETGATYGIQCEN